MILNNQLDGLGVAVNKILGKAKEETCKRGYLVHPGVDPNPKDDQENLPVNHQDLT